MKVVYTGFKGQGNSSCRLMDFFDGEKLLLTNSFDGLKRDIDSVSDGYGAAFMFGLDKNLKNSLRIELCAEKYGRTLYTAFDPVPLRKAFSAAGLNSTVSEVPTKYLCNTAYFHMLEKLAGKALFIHIPPIRYLPDDTAEAIVRAVHKFLQNERR